MGVARFAQRSIGTLSSGEQQRVLLARTLMNDPDVVLLDEPSARLDLAGRELLVRALDELATDPEAAPLVLVTHHVDEVPPGITHALLLRDGRALAAGPIAESLTGDTLSECFGVKLALHQRPDGRFSAWAS
jgi:iron complex transport system ATP-binding protein